MSRMTDTRTMESMDSSLREQTVCVECEEHPTTDRYKGDQVLRCPECGRILLRDCTQ